MTTTPPSPLPAVLPHYIDGAFVPDDNDTTIPVTNPSTGATLTHVPCASATTVATAIDAAVRAFPAWSRQRTRSARALILRTFYHLVQDHTEELTQLIVLENGKNEVEAAADIAKGLETVLYACSLGNGPAAVGHVQQVSSAVTCQDRREPLGVVVSIVPFNFPFMVPMWTIPIALVLGNTVILKPSEKVPLTMQRCAALFQQAGLPPGVLQLVHGDKTTVQHLLAERQPSSSSNVVQAVTFVGSSPVAALVASTCRRQHTRCTALGGAKNHLVVVLDDIQEQAVIDAAVRDIVVSFAGCAGQRCMAASVLLLVGGSGSTDDAAAQTFLARVRDHAATLRPGTGPGQVGPVIDRAAYDRIHAMLEKTTSAEQFVLDGRSSWKNEPATQQGGAWIGPTILLHTDTNDAVFQNEVFGPVLSVYRCASWEEAIAIENASPFGNAAAVYTTNGGTADWFVSRFRAAMLGVNIGIPVPREPFSFGGLYGTRSKYGDMDITGDGAVEFFSNRIKVSTRWPAVTAAVASPTPAAAPPPPDDDKANFAGSM